MGTVPDIIWRVCPCCNVSLRYCSACATYACVHVFEAFLLEEGLSEERRPLPSFPACPIDPPAEAHLGSKVRRRPTDRSASRGVNPG